MINTNVTRLFAALVISAVSFVSTSFAALPYNPGQQVHCVTQSGDPSVVLTLGSRPERCAVADLRIGGPGSPRVRLPVQCSREEWNTSVFKFAYRGVAYRLEVDSEVWSDGRGTGAFGFSPADYQVALCTKL
jgi:hypothetical protein